MNCKRSSNLMYVKQILGVVFALILFQTQAFSAAEITEEFQSDTIKLMEMTGAANAGLQLGTFVTNQMIDILRQQYPEMPEKAAEAIKDEIGKVFAEEIVYMTAAMVPIYAKYYSHEEIKGLISFYKSALGQKSIKVLPQILNESMLAGQQWGKSLESKLDRRIQERFEKEGFGNKM